MDRSLVSTIGFKPLVILDIGCGEKSLGKGVNEIFGDRRPISLKYVSIDIDPITCPDLCWNILSFFDELRTSPSDVRNLLAPGKVDIVWFSSQCDLFSQASTRGARDVQEGLTLVEAGIRISRYLRPRVFFMESADSGLHRLAGQLEQQGTRSEPLHAV